MSPNYSLYALPAFWLIGLAPHTYAVALITRETKGNYDNAKARGAAFCDYMKKRVPAASYATYERAKAAHANSVEILPLFAAALAFGNMARLPNGTLNNAAFAFLAVRVAYALLYINITSKKLSYARSAAWFVGIVICMVLIFKAANEFCYGRMSV